VSWVKWYAVFPSITSEMLIEVEFAYVSS
jgi:hypothetical protein